MTYALYLNDDLKESFKATEQDHYIIEHEMKMFSGGEPHIKIHNLEELVDCTTVIIITKLRTPEDVLKLQIAVNALNYVGNGASYTLLLGYFPGSRQDRVCNPGEAFTLGAYADIINNMSNWNGIQMIDAHSDVTPAVIGAGVNISNEWFIRQALPHIDITEGVIVSPDAGANKKVHDIMKTLDYHYPDKFDMVRADKHRDIATGNIIETIVYADDLTGKDCIIIDDICDGGRTFIELAKVLKSKGAANVILIVTHGIFSKGYDVVLEHVDQIVTTNSFANLSDDNDDTIIVMGLDEHYYKFKLYGSI